MLVLVTYSAAMLVVYVVILIWVVWGTFERPPPCGVSCQKLGKSIWLYKHVECLACVEVRGLVWRYDVRGCMVGRGCGRGQIYCLWVSRQAVGQLAWPACMATSKGEHRGQPTIVSPTKLLPDAGTHQHPLCQPTPPIHHSYIINIPKLDDHLHLFIQTHHLFYSLTFAGKHLVLCFMATTVAFRKWLY